MKVTVFLVIALIATSAYALKPKKVTTAQQNRIKELKNGNTWAGILLNLAEIHMMSKGPIDELVQAIEDTIVDLQFKREKRDEAYVKRTNEHNALVAQLESDIANCEQDIEDIEGILTMLAEQKAALEEENALLTRTNANIKTAVAEATTVRAKQHDEYLVKVDETEQAIAAVDECLTILNEFAYGAVSFAQVKKAKVVLAETQRKVAKLHNVESALLNALVQVAVSQEFADHSAVTAVIDKFHEIRENLYSASEALAADEIQQQNEFEKFCADSAEEIYNNEQTIEYNNGQLVVNAQNTIDNQNLLAQRKQDLADFQQALDDENTSFEEATARYEAYCAENDREVAVCNEALEVVSTVDLADYISDRVNAEDGLISSGMATAQAHGQGTEVFNFDYQD